MHRHRLGWIGSALLLELAACSAPGASFMARYGSLEPDGEIGLQQGSSVSATSQVDRLGLEKDSSVLGGRVDLEFGAPHLTISASQSTHDGSGVAEAVISSGGTTINVGDPVTSELDLGIYEAMLTWDLFPGDTVELGIGLGISALDVNAKFTEDVTGQSVDTDQILPIPVIAGRLGFDVWRVNVSALVGWIELNYQGDRASFLDADLLATLRVLGSDGTVAGRLGLGYRFMNVAVEYEDGSDAVDADIDFDGPYFGLMLSL